MRILTIAAAAAVLLLPAAQQASAAAKKPTIQMSAKTKKEKVEYMRSAAGPEPVVKKHRKHKKHKMKKDKM
ncbi:MAG: hypothetical protein ACRD9W_07335 [Terriglobia bacterium]